MPTTFPVYSTILPLRTIVPLRDFVISWTWELSGDTWTLTREATWSKGVNRGVVNPFDSGSQRAENKSSAWVTY